MQNAKTEKAKPSRAKLSRTVIVECALAIVRAEGLEALTMRRVAAELKAGAMSLYRHVEDRDDLLLGMMDHVALAIEAPEILPDDRQEIVAIIMTLHEEFRRDPWIVHVLLFEGRGSLKILPLIERLLGALARLGCDPSKAIDHYGLLLHYAYGECLSYQMRGQRLAAQKDWSKEAFSEFPQAMAISEAAQNWAHDEFERNVTRIVASI